MKDYGDRAMKDYGDLDEKVFLVLIAQQLRLLL